MDRRLSFLYNPDEVLAKSGEKPKSVIAHTLDTIFWWQKAIKWYNSLISVIAQEARISNEELKIRLFLTAAFHDVGKGNQEFQKKIRKWDFTQPESHALFGLPIIWSVIKDQPLLKDEKSEFYPEILAIATHHSALTKEVFSTFEGVKPKYVGHSFFEQFFKCINQRGKQIFRDHWQPITFQHDCLENAAPFELLRRIRNQAIDFANNRKSINVRQLFLLFQSILHTADWLASSGVHEAAFFYSPNLFQPDFTTNFRDFLQQEDRIFDGWKPFQEEMAKSDQHIITQIPTGQGKTEGSLLWALRKPEQKILFLLPTQVTVNKLYSRLNPLFLNREIGLSHGNARFMLKNEKDIVDQQWRIKLLYSRSFFLPITVATVDQLIYSFFNWGKWSLTGNAVLQANIIIDEIHLYDGFTLGLTLKAIQQGAKFGARFCVMSATMPSFLRQNLEGIFSRAGGFTLIDDPRFSRLQRHKITLQDRSIEGVVEEVLSDFRKSKKVLIVCNTKGKARELFDLIFAETEKSEQKNLLLYHSQFIIRDRKDKEETLERIGKTTYTQPFIAVCTQVVEVSLDLDFDVLYTENAPIDALIQRLGRVNRKDEKPYAKVVICQHSAQSEKFIYKKAVKIMNEGWRMLRQYADRLNGNLQEQHFSEILINVYTWDNLDRQYREEFKNGKKFFRQIWDDVTKYILTLDAQEANLQNISSRLEEYVQVDCVLLKHFRDEELIEKVDNKDYDAINEFLIKIPLWLLKSEKYKVKELWEGGIPVVDLKYNSDTGISYETDIDDQID